MKKLFIAFVVFIVLLSCNTQQKTLPKEDAKHQPQATTHTINPTDSLAPGIKHVNDHAHLYSVEERKILDSLIEGFQKSSGLPVAVITFDSTRALAATVEELTRTIGIQYGNAITVGIAPAQRGLYIWNDSLVNNTLLNEVETKDIIDQYFVPRFKDGQYFKGTEQGLRQIFATIRRKGYKVK